MILHDYLPSGNGYKVRLLLAQLGITFERIEYDVTAGETRTPEFLAYVNPNGRVPVLELDDGRLLPESDAILFYMADGTPLFPEGRLERARVRQWVFFETNPHRGRRLVLVDGVHHTDFDRKAPTLGGRRLRGGRRGAGGGLRARLVDRKEG